MSMKTRSMGKKRKIENAKESAVPKKKARKTTPKKASAKQKAARKKKAAKKQPKKFGEGSDAPDFQGVTNEHDEPLSLSDFAGQYLVLYFYPRDNTPGCTAEGKRFRELKEQFDALNCEILGVSADKASAHQKFINKYDFNFSLLADTERKLIRAYGASKAGNRIQRSTFLIDPEGVIVKVWNPVRGAAKHPDEVLKALEEMM